MLALLKYSAGVLFLRGVLMVVFGLGALLFPSAAAAAIAAGFGVLLILAGLLLGLAAAGARRQRTPLWQLLMGEAVLAIAMGGLALFLPSAAAKVVLLMFGVVSLAVGLLQASEAYQLSRETRKTSGMWLSAACSIALGLGLLWQPAAAVTAIVWLLAAYALLLGILSIAVSLQARTLRQMYYADSSYAGVNLTGKPAGTSFARWHP